MARLKHKWNSKEVGEDIQLVLSYLSLVGHVSLASARGLQNSVQKEGKWLPSIPSYGGPKNYFMFPRKHPIGTTR